ncbi:hypothetical protein [Actinomadura flavalba]|uniref:hypothetical protein n=1 Tax=Actinomadura flavalba TaxID=1120938 RepID=UPI000373CDE5|nr:hypothetical protein [Actinomadura flavalba]
MTVVLVLLCLAIAGREVYMAFDRRLPRAERDIRTLRAQVAELGARLERPSGPETVPVAPPQPDGVAAPGDDRLGGVHDRLAAVDARLAELHDRVAQLDERTGRAGERLDTDLADIRLDREAQRSLARSLDAVEQDVGELHQEMLERLARRDGVVTGVLLSEEGESEALLADAFERCAAEHGLRVRIRDHHRARSVGGGAFLGTSYHLSGRRPDALAEELFAQVRGLHDPQDRSPLAVLLTELAQLRGAGLARIGPFTAVRTANTLLCGLLPAAAHPVPSEPWELAAQLRDLPESLQSDLTWLHTDE